MAATNATSDAAGTTNQISSAAGTRLAGFAGMSFALSVIAQNLWSSAAGVLPAPDATAAEVVEGFVDAGDAPAVLAGWVAVNLVVLAVFLAGAHVRLRQQDPVWAGVGLIGGLTVMAMFATLQVPIVALAVGGQSLNDSPELVSALWSAHGTVFAFAGVGLGLALLGFSRAAATAGMVPAWFGTVGPLAAAVMIVASIPVQAGAEGEPITMIGLVGFIAWLVFLLMFGNRLRQER